MNKKIYQQPKTVSLMMEPSGILCGSPKQQFNVQWDGPLNDGVAG